MLKSTTLGREAGHFTLVSSRPAWTLISVTNSLPPVTEVLHKKNYFSRRDTLHTRDGCAVANGFLVVLQHFVNREAEAGEGGMIFEHWYYI
jgi:tetrahydrodipicolinate N-succinyltransferase